MTQAATEVHGITNEMLKEDMVNCLHVVFQQDVTDKDGLIVSLFKKGDKKAPENYRGITLLDCIRKVFTKIISNRIYDFLEKKNFFEEGQAGFRRGRSCSDNVFCVSQILINRKNRKSWQNAFNAR